MLTLTFDPNLKGWTNTQSGLIVKKIRIIGDSWNYKHVKNNI